VCQTHFVFNPPVTRYTCNYRFKYTPSCDISDDFFRPRNVWSSAFRQHILCPEEKTEVRPAIFLESQLEKVTGLSDRIGTKVVTLLHNTLWPRGYPPSRLTPKLVRRLDSLFSRWGSSATIGVSPECVRQVDQPTRGHHKPLFQIRAQFLPGRFEKIEPPPLQSQQAFRICTLVCN